MPNLRRLALEGAAMALCACGADRLLERRNGGGGGVILAFHDIQATTLERLLDRVARAYMFVSLTELVEHLRYGRSTAGKAAITFDDGIAQVVEDASDLAARRGWPMTFFLPTRFLDSGRPYWFHELTALLRSSHWDQRGYVLRSSTYYRLGCCLFRLAPVFWLTTHQMARNQRVMGVCVPSKTVPAVTDT